MGFCQDGGGSGGGHSQARLFIAEGVKSTVFMQDSAASPNDESTPTFMPDGKTVYMANKGAICLSRKAGDHWTRPMPISFTGKYKDWDPTLTPDGRRLLFVSNRPYTAADGSIKAGNHLWMSQQMRGGRWSEPRHLDSPVNEFGFVNYGPSISARERSASAPGTEMATRACMPTFAAGQATTTKSLNC